MYFPIIGLSILIAWGAADLAERWRVQRSALGALAMASLVALATAAWVQVGTWRNTETLYLRALEVTERNYLAHKALGNELLRQQRIPEAAHNFAQAALLAPGWSPAQLGLADVDVVRGRIAEALQGYREVLERDPSNTGAAGRYGLALGLAGRYAEARVQLSRALLDHRGTAELHRAMADIEAALGNPEASVRHGREALRLMPDYVDAANNLAWTLATCHDPGVRNPEEAVRLIEAAALGSDDPQLLDTLAAAYAAAGRFDQAVTIASRAAALASARGEVTMDREIRSRLSLYQLGKPFVSPPAAHRVVPPAG
jgi:tetratricopeptide (TPR) repeat protein